MNKQQKTYGLLLAVLVIWGMIGYQVYIRLNPPTPEFKTNQIKTSFKRQQGVDYSFYELSSTYRDPFLGGFQKKKRIVKKKRVITKPKPRIPFPRVVYNGMIEGGNSKSFILTINRKQEILKIGQVFQGVRLLKATKSEAQVKFEKEIKTIVKQ